MKDKKKLFIIIAVVLVVCVVVCCVVSAIAGYKGITALVNQSNEIADELLIEVCEGKNSMSASDYNNWFVSTFRNTNSQTATEDILNDAFPSDFNCQDLHFNNIFDLFSRGMTFNIQYANGVTTADLTYQVEDGLSYKLSMRKVDGEWKIVSISNSIF